MRVVEYEIWSQFLVMNCLMQLISEPNQQFVSLFPVILCTILITINGREWNGVCVQSDQIRSTRWTMSTEFHTYIHMSLLHIQISDQFGSEGLPSYSPQCSPKESKKKTTLTPLTLDNTPRNHLSNNNNLQ